MNTFNTFKVVSDVICPWCYIGKRRLEAALGALPVPTATEVSWHPFQLNPDMPPGGIERREYCVNKFGSWERCEEMFEQIAQVGKTVGIDFRFERSASIPNTFDLHRLIWLGGQLGLQDALVEALFRSYFCEGVNLSVRSALLAVVAEAGLEPQRAQQLLDGEEGAAQVRAEEQEIKRLGISAVPLFIIAERLAVSGAQPPEVLLKALEQARSLQSPPKRPAPARAKSRCKV